MSKHTENRVTSQPKCTSVCVWCFTLGLGGNCKRGRALARAVGIGRDHPEGVLGVRDKVLNGDLHISWCAGVLHTLPENKTTNTSYKTVTYLLYVSWKIKAKCEYEARPVGAVQTIEDGVGDVFSVSFGRKSPRQFDEARGHQRRHNITRGRRDGAEAIDRSGHYMVSSGISQWRKSRRNGNVFSTVRGELKIQSLTKSGGVGKQKEKHKRTK